MVKLLTRRPFDFDFVPYKTIDDLFNSLFYSIPKTSKPPRSMSVKDGKLVIQYALAGFKEEDISVSVNKNILIISASNEGSVGVDQKFTCTFREEFVAGENIDLQSGKVDFTNGLLTIELVSKDEEVGEEKQLFGSSDKKEIKHLTERK
jgi:HSP20 family molecular chaperone IbpA